MKNPRSIAKSIALQNKRSPILRLFFAQIGPFFPQEFELYFGDEKIVDILVKTASVTTPVRVEKWMFRQVLRTSFKDYVVEDNRYKLDFELIPYAAAEILFYKVLGSDGTKSWLEPLQEIMLSSNERKRKNSKALVHEEYEEDGDYVPEPFKAKPYAFAAKNIKWAPGPLQDKYFHPPIAGQAVQDVPPQPPAVPNEVANAAFAQALKKLKDKHIQDLADAWIG